jgi:aspartyl-tRNA(Asn)/glutamyl-tRNA(Gln) amidotransferase subunit C
MALEPKTVRHIARLARIHLAEQEVAPLVDELSRILAWIEQLDEVKTEGVDPMTCVAPMRFPERKDVVNDGGQPDKVLANAPDRVGDFYTVPKVIE